MAPAWQRQLPPLLGHVDAAACRGEAFVLNGERKTRRKTLAARDVAQLIAVLNDGATYWPAGNLCHCCPAIAVRMTCGGATTETILDLDCGWVTPADAREQERAMSAAGKRALTDFAARVYPEFPRR